MAVGTAVSVEDLRTSYRPDCDYVDGEVLERKLGEWEHSSAQREILFYFRDFYPQLRESLLPEQRVQVKASCFRVPTFACWRRTPPVKRSSPSRRCCASRSCHRRTP